MNRKYLVIRDYRLCQYTVIEVKFYFRMSKGNVLVTGGSGYIGSHTVVELLKEDYSAIVVDNMANSVENEQGFPESLKRVQKITGKDLTFYKLDIRKLITDILFYNNIL